MAENNYRLNNTGGFQGFLRISPSKLDFPQNNIAAHLANANNVIQQRKYDAAGSLGAMDDAFAKISASLHQDDETRMWFEGFKNKYRAPIEDAISQGKYQTAVILGKELAHRVLADNELQSRIDSNVNYQQHKSVADTLLKTGKISQSIYDQWIDENPYKYNPIKNQFGEVIGNKEWTPSWTPIEPANMAAFYEEVRKLAAEEIGSAEAIRYVDENGKTVTNPANGMYSMEIKTGSSWKRLPASKLKRMFDSILSQNPQVKATFEQEYNNKLWQFSKAKEHEKGVFYGTEVMDNQGNKYTLDEYINRATAGIFKDMEINEHHSTISSSINSTLLSARLSQMATANENRALMEQSVSPSAPMVIPMDEELVTSYGSLQNSISTIRKLYGGTELYKRNKNIIEGYINRNDYDGLSNFLNGRRRFIKDTKDLNALDSALRNLKSDGLVYNKLLENATQDEKDVLNTYAAIQSGTPFTNAPNNKYVQGVAKAKNKLFSHYSLSGNNKSLNTPANRFFAAFNDDNYYNTFISRLEKYGITKQNLEDHGIRVRRESGKIIADIYKNCDILPEVATIIQEIDNGRDWNWRGIGKFTNWGDHKVTLGRYYKDNYVDIGNGNRARRSSNRIRPSYDSYSKDDSATRDALFMFSSNSPQMENLQSRANNILKKYGHEMVSTGAVSSYGSFGTYALQGALESGAIKFSDVKAQDDWISGKERDLIAGDLGHIADFKVWKYDKDSGNLLPVSLQDMDDVQKELDVAIANDKFLINTMTTDTRTGAGHRIFIPAKVDKEGDQEGDQAKAIYYVEGLAGNNAMKAVANNPDLLYNKEYHKARSLNLPTKDIVGNYIDYNGNDEVARDKYVATKKLDEIFEENKNIAVNAKAVPNRAALRKQYDDAISVLMTQSNIDPNSPKAKVRKLQLVNELERQFDKYYNSK